MNVAILGQGGREHALARHVYLHGHRVLMEGGNLGMEYLLTLPNTELIGNDEEDRASNLERFIETGLDLVIPGPEMLIDAGIADACKAEGIKCFAPSKAAGQLESSKQFSKDFMQRHGIPTAAYLNVSSGKKALEYLAKQPEDQPIVIKKSGLAAGKGVTVANNRQQAIDAVNAIINTAKTPQDEHLVIEEFMQGKEVSLIAMACEDRFVILPECRDHKRAYDGDKGPNTGGMGVFSPVADFSDELRQQAIETIIKPTLQGMMQDGMPFTGFLYAGLMITPDREVKVVEFNVRLGDPEAQLILSRVDSDLTHTAIELLNDDPITPIKISDKHLVGVCLASAGYPDQPLKLHCEIKGAYPFSEIPSHSEISMAGVKLLDDKPVNTGGRILLVTGSGKNMEQARSHAYETIENIECEGAFYRTDIGVESNTSYIS